MRDNILSIPDAEDVEMKRVLSRLAGVPGNTVYLLSGRSREELDFLTDVPNLGIS